MGHAYINNKYIHSSIVYGGKWSSAKGMELNRLLFCNLGFMDF